MVELTFDDGPDSVWTPRVLAALDAARLRATFYVIAARVAAHDGLVDEMRAAGHAVQLHCGAAHVRHTRSTHSEVAADTGAALDALAAAGIRPRRWRTPWGLVMPWTRDVAARHGLALTGWTIDAHDWRGDAAGAMLARIEAALVPGAVVLLHDGVADGARRDGCAETVAFIPRLAEALTARGLAAGIPDPPPASAFPPPRGGSLPVAA